ncbi:uncharacterized protein PV09_05620 [Verruconis gallopava]|uniref:DWNN domain-containing protein n=1 Tax=Verruconis gallopava TaxID=253628 RepID=A0A0D1XKV0_9PEZI|nr:uncharacterized protein PV09_05620 [Verruconis gallopava]KIW02956.1 hypothetical protein PV09_05620 [Verruconis gallopava]
MTSTVFFKFKSQKEPQRVTFDGTGITVFELKREIITISGLGDGTDFDLSLYDDTGAEEYTDDTTIIPRSSSVIVRRLPPSLGPGRGKASRYVTGKAPVKAINKNVTSNPSTTLPDFSAATNEAERLNAIFAAEGASWEQQQQEMAQQKRVQFKSSNKRPLNVPDHEPPPKYVCHRCGQPGHWIQMCPTNSDPNFESKPKIKRTTGIPRSFMKKLDKPLGEGEIEEGLQGGTIMLDADGNHVIVNPDTATWKKAEAKLNASAAQKQEAEAAGSKELRELGLECPIDKKLFENPVKTPCCGKTYCHDCIENALVDNDLECPNCQRDGVLIDDLTVDEDIAAKIRKYEDDKIAEKKAREKDQAVPKSPKVETADIEESKSPAAAITSPSPEVKEPSPAPSNASIAKKRPADESLENPRSPPKAPKSMLAAQQQNIPPGFDPKFMEMMMQYAPQDFGNSQQFQNQIFNPNMMGMMGITMPSMMSMPNAMINPMMMMMGNGMQSNTFNNQAMGTMGYNDGSNGINSTWQQHNGGGYAQNDWHQGATWSNNRGFGVGYGGGGENSAYARGPVNPNRARGRQQRQARNDDYNTL